MNFIRRAWDWIRSKVSRTYDYVRRHWIGSAATAITVSYCGFLAVAGSWMSIHIVLLLWLYGYIVFRRNRNIDDFLSRPDEKTIPVTVVR